MTFSNVRKVEHCFVKPILRTVCSLGAIPQKNPLYMWYTTKIYTPPLFLSATFSQFKQNNIKSYFLVNTLLDDLRKLTAICPTTTAKVERYFSLINLLLYTPLQRSMVQETEWSTQICLSHALSMAEKASFYPQNNFSKQLF